MLKKTKQKDLNKQTKKLVEHRNLELEHAAQDLALYFHFILGGFIPCFLLKFAENCLCKWCTLFTGDLHSNQP